LSPSPPASAIRPLGYRAAMIRLRAEAASTSHSLPLPPPIIFSHTRPDALSSGTPPLHLLSTDCREDRPKVTLPPRKRLGIALGPRYEIGESSSAAAARPAGGLRADYGFVATMDREIKRDLERDVGYGITDFWDEIVEAMQGTPVVTDVANFSQRMTEFETRVRQDTDEIYTRLDDEQSDDAVITGTGDHTTGTGDSTTGTGYRTAGTAGTRWRSCTARAARGGWYYIFLVIEENGTKTRPRKAMINQGVTAALAARDANRNGDDSHTSGTGGRRTERVARECTYQDL
ncbi:hypothetical protein Tco_0804871, partial [Tanacetum coccineum]